MRLHLTLYLAGAATARSVTAKRRLDRMVHLLDAEVYVDVVDVLEAPERAEQEGVFATPTLVRDLPPPGQRVIGDLGDVRRVVQVLGLEGIYRPEEDRDAAV